MLTVAEYIKKKNPSEITLRLIEKLRAFSEDDDYILGTLAESPYDIDRQLIIDYIDYGEDVSYENVILFSLQVGIEREKLERELNPVDNNNNELNKRGEHI